MNLYFRLWWLSLGILFFFEILASSFFNFKLSKDIIILFTLIVMPLFNILIGEIKKDFFHASLKFSWINIIKYLTILIAILFYTNFIKYNIFELLIFIYFIFSVLFVFESRLPFLIALILLSYCPIFLITNNNANAELFAVYTYYFLCIWVITQILEFKFNEIKSNKIQNEE